MGDDFLGGSGGGDPKTQVVSPGAFGPNEPSKIGNDLANLFKSLGPETFRLFGSGQENPARPSTAVGHGALEFALNPSGNFSERLFGKSEINDSLSALGGANSFARGLLLDPSNSIFKQSTLDDFGVGAGSTGRIANPAGTNAIAVPDRESSAFGRTLEDELLNPSFGNLTAAQDSLVDDVVDIANSKTALNVGRPASAAEIAPEIGELLVDFSNDRTRNLNNAFSTDSSFLNTQRGQDVDVGVQNRSISSTERGQDIDSLVTQRGQDITDRSNLLNALNTEAATKGRTFTDLGALDNDLLRSLISDFGGARVQDTQRRGQTGDILTDLLSASLDSTALVEGGGGGGGGGKF